VHRRTYVRGFYNGGGSHGGGRPRGLGDGSLPVGPAASPGNRVSGGRSVPAAESKCEICI